MTPAGRRTTLAVFLAVSSVAAQDPTPAGDPQLPDVEFHVEVNYVEVDARVLDGSGAFVRDLTRDDFEVREDGVVQRIDRFSLVDIPLEQPDRPEFLSRPIEADVATNARAYDGRLYLIVLDDLHVAPLRTQLARNVARRFVETRLGVNDQAAILTTLGTSLDRQGFTGNRTILLDAVDRFVGQKLQSETIIAVNTPEVVDTEQQETRFAPGSDPIALQRAQHARAAMTTLRNAAEFMAGIRGRRKALVYISEGIDYDIHDMFGNSGASEVVASSRAAVAAATRANVAIYAIDPRGLSALGDDIAELEGQAAGDTSTRGPRSLLREQQTSHDSLRELSDLTGGFAAVNVRDTGPAFDRIVAENSSYYVLAYYASNTRRQGRLRRLDVRVRRPGLQVLARDSYIEPRRNETPKPAQLAADVPAALLDVLRSPLPLTGLTLSATAAAFKGSGRTASVPVVVEVKGDELGLLNEGNVHTGLLDVAVWAAPATGGRAFSEHRQVSLNLGPGTFKRITEYGLKVVLRLELPPGRYQLRVAALAADIAAQGSVFHDLDVPDFSRAPLSISNVVLTSAMASRVLTVQPDERLSAVLPASPTTIREFSIGDQIAFLAEIYDNDRRPHSVDISTSILTGAGRDVFTVRDSRSSEDLRASGADSYGVVYEVPLAAFEPGLYVLRIGAGNPADPATAILRDVQFRIRP